ncbi:polysaccharide deacetylase family protein [Ornithinibacillus sp. 179-J 7C1 HS]|uniref:polysaccharide deacetylase family protein n=1 Tax=Ornithinibacillus sp. 179-J 7C1 HS TaxID=3142384 RepID=UPI00399F6549
MLNRGKFVISLDFELNWGVFDVYKCNQYEKNLIGARESIPMMLSKFKKYNIHATWAIVGFLFFSNKESLLQWIPKEQPLYKEESLSAYKHLQHIGENEVEDPYHFGLSLINHIRRFPNQEIASHTFSHYYCLAKGQYSHTFEADLQSAITIAEQHGISIKTLIFPRNQVNQDYLNVCESYGLTAYRGCEEHWLYQIKQDYDGKIKRAIRLLDSYINLSGHHIYNMADWKQERSLVNIPSSRFMRPYSKQLKLFEGLKLKRIKTSMTKAALEGKLYHLWWHPHNFGADLEKNIKMLEHILEHYCMLRNQYGMESLTMREVSERLSNKAIPESQII